MIRNKFYALAVISGMLIGSIGITSIGADSKLTEDEAIEVVDENDATLEDDTVTQENSDLSEETEQPANEEKPYVFPFSDVEESDWYYEYVDYLTMNKVVKGLTETEYSPKGIFTVAESSAIITRYLGLEDEANERKRAMEVLGIPGSEKWYAGYIQLMHEAGIIDLSKYGCTVHDKLVYIDSFDKLETPVKRYEFCTFVVRSFELDGTEIRTGEDKTGLGHEFITGGKYDESILEKYAPFIADYNKIPLEYSYYILKAYYNGIINGDDFGNFNPNNNLSRAEMAKITAVIMDKSLRKYVDITVPLKEKYIFSKADFLHVLGKNILKPIISDMILQNEATSVKTSFENDKWYISYVGLKDAPVGFDLSFVHYCRNSAGFDVDVTNTASKHQGFEYKNTYNEGDKCFILLTDLATGEVLDAYEFTLLTQGLMRADDCTYYA